MVTRDPVTSPENDMDTHKNNVRKIIAKADDKTDPSKKTDAAGIVSYEPKRFDNVAFQPKLPIYEMYTYYAIIVSCFAFGVYAIYHYSKDYAQQNEKDYYLQQGWSFLSNKKDYSDYEWLVWIATYKKLIGTQVLHSVVSLIVSHFAYQYRRHAWFVIGLICMFYILGWKLMCVVASMTTTLYIVSLSASVIFTWIVAFAWLTIFNVKAGSWTTLWA